MEASQEQAHSLIDSHNKLPVELPPSNNNRKNKSSKMRGGKDIEFETIDLTQPGGANSFMSFLENRLNNSPEPIPRKQLAALKSQLEQLIKGNNSAVEFQPLEELLQALESRLNDLNTTEPTSSEDWSSDHSESDDAPEIPPPPPVEPPLQPSGEKSEEIAKSEHSEHSEHLHVPEPSNESLGDGESEIPINLYDYQLNDIPSSARRSQGIPNVDNSMCEICYEVPDLFYELNCCHKYCKECLERYVKVRIESGWVQSIPCPNPRCAEPFVDSDVENSVSPEDYEKYQRFKMLAELRSEPTCRWCPNPDCASPVIGDPRDPHFPCLTCDKCQTKFCYECNQHWHPNVTCKKNEKALRKKGMIDKKGEKWKKDHKTRKCLQCRMDIEKDRGCNHITCTYCGYQFCWICMKPFTPDHYINGNCAGLQFSRHPIAKRRLKKFGHILAGVLVVVLIIGIGVPVVIIFFLGVVVPILLIGIPIYLIYRLVKYVKRRREKKRMRSNSNSNPPIENVL